MLTFLEHTWPVWWILAILVLLRWFHVSSLLADDSESQSRTPAMQPTSHGASPLEV